MMLGFMNEVEWLPMEYVAITLKLSIRIRLCYCLKEKKTVLHYGAIMGHVPLIQILTRFGADVNAVDKVS